MGKEGGHAQIQAERSVNLPSVADVACIVCEYPCAVSYVNSSHVRSYHVLENR